MPALILVHRGNHKEWNPIDWEWVRVWARLKEIASQQWIDIRAAKILAIYDDEISQDTWFWIRAMNVTADTF